MFSTPREKRLAAIFGGSIVLFLLWQTVGQILLQPLSDAQSQLTAALAANEQLQHQSNAVEHALRNLKQSAGSSLPSDPGKASVLYQGWLIRHLENNGIGTAVVTPAPPIVVQGVGHRIPVMIQFSGPMMAIAAFLDQFHASPLLHRMTNLSITSVNDSEADHRVSISVEALSLATARDTDELPATPPTDESAGFLAIAKSDDFFRRQFPTVVEVETTNTTPEPQGTGKTQFSGSANQQDTAREASLRFVASVWNGSEREAWLVDQRSRKELSVVADADLTVSNIKARVLAVSEDSLLLDLSGTQTRINLGETVGNASL